MRTRPSRYLAAALVLAAALLPVTIALAYDWPVFDGGGEHTGNNNQESILNSSNVNTLIQKYQASLPSTADGAPVYLSNVQVGASIIDILYVTTKNGFIVALNAHTGVTLWSHQYGPGSCKINNGSSACYTTSSPAIDPNRQFVYSYGLDGFVHKWQAVSSSASGTEITTGGWPELVTTKAFDEKESPALSIATDKAGVSYLYVSSGGYPGDNGDYQGHITVINLSDGSQKVFNALCSNQTVHFVEQPGSPDCPEVQTAIWARSSVVYDPDTDKIYMSTGNGTFDPTNFDWGDTDFELNPDGTGITSGTFAGDPLDTYTPTNFQSLQNGDTDLGSTAPVILPVPAGFPFPHIALQSGKDAMLRLINLDNMSNQGTGPQPGRTGGELLLTNVPQGGEVLTAPIAWVNPADGSTWVFVVNDSGASALQLGHNGSTLTLTKKWQIGTNGTSPLIVNGMLFYEGGSKVRAFNPTTGAQLWSGSIGGQHWESPIVADGWVYALDESAHLTAFSLPNPPPTNTPTATFTPLPLTTDTIGVYRNGLFLLRDSNTTGNADIVASFSFGSKPYPVVGTWTGGPDSIGVYDLADGQFFLRNTSTSGSPDEQFVFGSPNDLPIVGRWTGVPKDGPGVFRPSNGLLLLKNTLSTGFADYAMVLGVPGDVGMANDWNGDQVDSPGVWRPTIQSFLLSNQVCNCSVFADYAAQLGNPGDVAITGDWIGQGHSGIGVLRPTNGLVLLKNQIATGFADIVIVYGIPNDTPLAGHWTAAGGSMPPPGLLVGGTRTPEPVRTPPASSGSLGG